MSDLSSLTGQLLVSLPGLKGDYFAHSVTLIIEHNAAGAFGLVINKPIDANLKQLLAKQDIHCSIEITLLESGPVETDRLFFLHSNEIKFDGSVVINDDLTLSTSLELIDAVSTTEPDSGVRR